MPDIRLRELAVQRSDASSLYDSHAAQEMAMVPRTIDPTSCSRGSGRAFGSEDRPGATHPTETGWSTAMPHADRSTFEAALLRLREVNFALDKTHAGVCILHLDACIAALEDRLLHAGGAPGVTMPPTSVAEHQSSSRLANNGRR